jgi:hypothetical protein
MQNIIKVFIIAGTAIFSLACGILLVRIAIPLYFKLFSPISQTLHNFYIAMGVFAFLLLILVVIFFKIGKYNWGIWILGTAVLLLGFGIPLFMLENNNMIWHEVVFHKPGPAYFIDFSEEEVSVLKYISDLYEFIWDKVYWYVYASIGVYLAAYIYLWKKGWRIGSIRIKA